MQRARFRRQAAPVQLAIADRIDQLNPAHWDEVTGHRGLLMSRDYHRELGRVRPANVAPCYAMVYRDERPLAALAMQLVEVQGSRLRKAKLAEGLRGLKERAAAGLARHVRTRVLVLGNVLTYGNHGIAIRPGHEADPDVWHGIGEATYRVRRAAKHTGSADFVLVKDLNAAELEQSAMLRRLGFRAIETEPNMVLALRADWRTHDDYLAALAKKYRKNVVSRVLKPIDEQRLRLRRLDGTDDVAAAAPRLHELYLAVHDNAALRPVTLGPDYWPALQRCAGNRARFAVLEGDGRALGFIVTLRDDTDTALAYHIGFDREAAVGSPLYLRLLQRSIEDGIDLGARRLSFGRTALEPKAMLGARPEPLHVWVRHRQGVLNKLLRSVLGFVHHDEAPARNPFGDSD